jgi:MFS family permease
MIRRPLLLLYAARAIRSFSDGFAVIILPAYLAELGFDPFRIGVVATVALFGTALATLTIGLLGSHYNPRGLLVIGALLMAATGVAFAVVEQFAIIAIIAFVGTINPTSSDLGILAPLEHTTIARLAADAERTRTFANYSLTGALATAAGALAAAAPDLMVAHGAGRLVSFQAMFFAYALLGVLGAAFYAGLPQSAHKSPVAAHAPLGQSRGVVYKLAALFSLDAFAGGLAVPSLVALWLFERFDMSLTAASLFFFWSNLLAAFSYPVAARLAGRFGLINTMVFTHIPSSLFLIGAAFSPNLPLALGLLLARAALSQMDVPTRTSYVMAVVTPDERQAAASFTITPRGLASAAGPAFAGAMLATPFPGLPLVLCGVLKIVYDVALLASFRSLKPPEEKV